MLSRDQLDILACPACRGALSMAEAGQEKLSCGSCGTCFPIRDGIPILLVDEAENLPPQTHQEVDIARST